MTQALKRVYGIDLGTIDMVHVGRLLVYLSLLFSFASMAQYLRLFGAAVEAKEQKRADWPSAAGR